MDRTYTVALNVMGVYKAVTTVASVKEKFEAVETCQTAWQCS